MKAVKILCMHAPADMVGRVTFEEGRFVVRYRAFVVDVEPPSRRGLDAVYIDGLHPVTFEPVEKFHGSTTARCYAGRACLLDFDKVLAAARLGETTVRVPFVDDPM